MAVRFKPNMWCKECEQRIAAQRHTGRLSGTAIFLVSGLPGQASAWHCPNCGSTKVIPHSRKDLEDVSTVGLIAELRAQRKEIKGPIKELKRKKRSGELSKEEFQRERKRLLQSGRSHSESPADDPSLNRCPDCRAVNFSDASTCRKCGAQMTTDE